MTQLLASAKRHGVPPEDYARQLVEDRLALEREAQRLTFAQIMGPVRKAAGNVDESKIVTLVEKARSDYHQKSRGKKR